MQGGLSERMRGDRPHEEEKDQDEKQLQSHEAEPGLDHEASQEKPGAERVRDARGVHARVNVRHAHEADGAYDREERTGEDQRPARDIEYQLHHDDSSSAS
jgi:hypothetical protein